MRVILNNVDDATMETIGRVTIAALEWAEGAPVRGVCGCLAVQPGGSLMSFWTRNKESVSITFQPKDKTDE